MQLDTTRERDAHFDTRLREDLIIWLASVRRDGRPHLVPIWYLWEEGGTILFFSQPNVQKVRNIEHETRVMLALDTKDEGEDVVIVEGVAELLPAGTVDSTLPAYVEKYAEQMKVINTSPEKMAAEYTEAFRVTPTRFLPA